MTRNPFTYQTPDDRRTGRTGIALGFVAYLVIVAVAAYFFWRAM